MSALRSVGRSAATLDKDRASLCSFTFADGRRCRTPRQSGHLQFCCFHARKQAQTQAAEEIGRDASYFFSGRYLSACDLNAVLGRLFAATAQGHIKPKTAATLAYLAQVMVQCIQISQHEYAEAFGGDGWRRSVSSSVNDNSDYLYPPQPEQPQNLASQPPAPQVHPDAGRAATTSPSPRPGFAHSPATATQPAPSSPLPAARPTSPAIPSSTAPQHSPQQPPKPQALVSATPSAPRRQPPPASGPQPGPSGAPVLAPLPLRNPESPPGSRSS